MSANNAEQQNNKQDQLIAAARRNRELREKDYREQTLKRYPHICARCGREFEGKKLRELTVHHQDHNHDNNPPDGSNWELLCIYCHDDEHAPNSLRSMGDGPSTVSTLKPSPIVSPFEQLDRLIKN